MMNDFKTRTTIVMIGLFAALLLLAGCGGPTDEGSTNPSTGSETTSFTFDLSGFAPQNGTGSAPAAVGPAVAGAEARGSMLIIGPEGKKFRFDFNPIFDETALTITTTLLVKLDPGLYTFYLLMDLNVRGVASRYAGVAPVLIFKAVTNRVHLNLNPLLISGITDVSDLISLSRVNFDYPENIQAYINPRFGISIDGSAEMFFNVNKDSAKGPVVIMLAYRAAPYNLKCRFYDGFFVKVVCPVEVVVLPPPGEAPVQIESVPLTAETTYSNVVANSTATFLINIPIEIVNEIGGAGTTADPLSGRLSATATLVGAENTLTETALTLTPQVNTTTNTISHYQASLTVSGFKPGAITWALNFFDLRNGDRQFAYCASSIDVTTGTDPNSGSYVCDLQFIDYKEIAQFPVGSVNVSVNDPALVPGSVILANGQPVGITGSGAVGTAPGTYAFFLSVGSHTILAKHEMMDPYGSGKIVKRSSEPQTFVLDATQVQQVTLTLPPLAEPPKVTGTSTPQNATNVPVAATTSITFSKAMDQATTEAAFGIAPAIDGTLSWSGDFTVLSFKPASAWAENTAYKVAVGIGAKDSEGIPLQAAFELSFTTGAAPDTERPTVTGNVPGAGDTNVSVSTAISVTFSEAMDTASAEAAFSTTPATSGSFSWSGDNSVMTFIPGTSLAYSQGYTATVAASAADTSGNTLSSASTFSFTTGVQPDQTAPTVDRVIPANAATEVSINGRVTVEFSEKMDPATVESAFQITPSVSGSVSWSTNNVQMTFIPSQPLAYETTYTVTIGANATDTSGNPMGAAFSSVFKTATAPLVGSLTVEAAMTRRPTRRDDGYIDLDAPLKVKIPTRDQVEIAMDADGQPIGNSQRYLLFLYLGNVKCIYLGGKWERYIGWVPESITRRSFQSPSCNRGKSAGDIISVPQRRHDDDDDRHDGLDGQFHMKGAEIKARVISGDPAFNETRVRVTIPVVNQ